MKISLLIVSLFLVSASANAQSKCGVIKKLTVSGFAGEPYKVEFVDGSLILIKPMGTSGSVIINTAFITKAKFCFDSTEGTFSVEN